MPGLHPSDWMVFRHYALLCALIAIFLGFGYALLLSVSQSVPFSVGFALERTMVNFVIAVSVFFGLRRYARHR
jgi:hypothetical protein